MSRIIRVQLLRLCKMKNICFLSISPVFYYLLLAFVGAGKAPFSFTVHEFCFVLSDDGGSAFIPFVIILLSGMFTTSLWEYNIIALERMSGIAERDIIIGNTITIAIPVSVFCTLIFSLLLASLSLGNGFGGPDMHIFIRLIAFFIAALCVSAITVLCSFICNSGTTGTAVAVFLYLFLGVISGFSVSIIEDICGRSLQIFRALIPLYDFIVMLDASKEGVSANAVLCYSVICFVVHSVLFYFISLYAMKKLRRL